MEDAIDLELFVGTKVYPTIADAPVGILITKHDILIVKTEYYTNNKCDCYLLESGESYQHREGDTSCKSLIIK